MKTAVSAWLGVTCLGLILLLSGLTDSGGNSQPGLIVFGALTLSMGVSGLLGVMHDLGSSGSMFAVIGFIIPGYSLPFLVYLRGQGSETVDRGPGPARPLDRQRAGRDGGRSQMPPLWPSRREQPSRSPVSGLRARGRSGHPRVRRVATHQWDCRSPEPQLLCSLLVRARDSETRVGGDRSRGVQDLPRG